MEVLTIETAQLERMSKRQAAALLNRSQSTLKRYIALLVECCPYSFNYYKNQKGVSLKQFRYLEALGYLYAQGWGTEQIKIYLERNPLIEEQE